MRTLELALSVAVMASCTMHHRFDDTDTRADAGHADAGRPDAGHPDAAQPDDALPVTPSGTVQTVECGPNTCYHGEVCCTPLCGICTARDACQPGLHCLDAQICGGERCEPPVGNGEGFCCPTCDGDICPAAGTSTRSECPPVHCD